MAVDPSMEPMLEVFIYETTTLLEQLDEIMLSSERSKSFSSDDINEIFRIMHTIKGSSAMMDLGGMSSLAHAVEDVFYIIREDVSKMSDISEGIFDLVFYSLDFLKEEMDIIQGGGESESDPADLIAQLRALAASLNGTQAPPPPPSAPAARPGPTAGTAPADQPAEGTGDSHSVRVFFEDGCQMENIRAFMLLTQLGELCTGITSVPADPERNSGCSGEIITNGLLINFSLAPGVELEEVYAVIENSMNIKTYEPLDGPPVQDAPVPASIVSKNESKSTYNENKTADSDRGAKSPTARRQSFISVNQLKLDQLMDLVGEIVTTESMVVSNPDLRGLKLENFQKSARELRKLTDELQDVVMSMRMVPLSGVFQKMNRVVRDMCKKLDKEAELVVEGGETEVDKTINEAIADPFMHMVRNALDHAIEEPEERRRLGKPEVGTITMAARNVGNEIVITIADDGRGLDTEKLLAKARAKGLLTKPVSEYTDKEVYNLILIPGFSTNPEVTEFSGRGVGMDVVRKNIERMNGNISIDSEKNVGTTFTIKIPLTLAIVDGMELKVGGMVLTLPITSIQQSFKLSRENDIVYNTDGTEMIMLRGKCYRLIRLYEHFGIEGAAEQLSDGIIIQVESGQQVACLFVDELLGEQQVVVKPFPHFLNRYSTKQMGLSGCTILGDGSISLILDANTLLSYK